MYFNFLSNIALLVALLNAFSLANSKSPHEALAGTVNRGRDQREDNLLLQSLLNDKKIDRENYLVQESIIANLKQLKAQVNCCPCTRITITSMYSIYACR